MTTAVGRAGLYGRIAIGLVAVSSGSILVRLAPDAPPLAAAAWRLVLASLLLVPAAWSGGTLRTLRAKDVAWIAGSGVALALHFVLWFASLRHTSVASSVLLVSTHPVFVGIGSVLFLRERVSRSLAAGIAVAMFGSLWIGGADFQLGASAFHGDLLALGGGLCVAVYFLIGRSVQKRVAFVDYIAVSYGTAGLATVVAALVLHTPWVGFRPMSYAYLALLALVPQLLGHSTFNWALRHLSATRVSVLILGEPVVAALLAYVLFGESMSWTAGIGAAIILVGIFISQQNREAPSGARGRS